MPVSLQEEQKWAKDHPAPEATEDDTVLLLWNYPVAKADLAPEHRARLNKFLPEALTGAALGNNTHPSTIELYITGHASDSGDAASNDKLSRERAENVARYLLSRGVTKEQIWTYWEGANDPVDRGNNGLAAARNRSVNIYKYIPSEPERKPPEDIIEPPPPPERVPTFKRPPPTMSGLTFERVIPIDFPTYRSPNIIVTGKIEVTFKGKLTDKGDGFTGGVIVKPKGGLGVKAETEIAQHVKAKLAVDVKGDKPGIEFKGGLEKSDWWGKPDIGLQTKETFVYMSITVIDRPFPDFDIEDFHVSGTITVKGKIEFAPGPAVLARIAAAGSYIAAFTVSIGVAALVLSATVYGIDEAAAKQLQFARLIAGRQGIAARISYEIADASAEAGFRDCRLKWHLADVEMEAEFMAGADEITNLLRTPEEKNVWNKNWKQKYAADNIVDFQTLFGRVFDSVGGHNSEGTLNEAVALAVAE